MRLALLDPLVTLSLDPARIDDLFRARGAAPAFAAHHTPLDRARALFVSPVDDLVASDLDDVERFAEGAGARALVEAGRACGRDVSQWPLHESPPALAARLVAARADSPALTRVFHRARTRLDRSLAAVATYDLVAPSPRPPRSDDARDERLSAALRKALGDDLVAAFAIEDDATGELHAAALHEAPPRALVVRDPLGRLVSPDHRPLASIRFAYDPEAPRLSVKTAFPERLFALAAAFGEALFGDPAYFSDRPAFTLKPLQQRGAARLAAAKLPRGVVRARVVGVQCDTLAGARVEARGDEAWDALTERAGLAGYLTRATLRLDVAGEPRPIDVFLQLPYRCDVSERRCARLARQTVAALGWMDPGTLPDDAWTLAPWAHPSWRWAEALGSDAALKALAAAKLVTERRGARVTGEAFRRLGASYVTFDVPGEAARYALSEDLTAPARDVGEDELLVWALDPDTLADKMRRELGAAPPERPVSGVVDLGLVAIGAARVRFFYAMQAPDGGLAERIALACTKGAVPVVLVPAGRRVGEGLRHVELSIAEQLGAAPIGRVVGKVAEALELVDVEPWRRSGARVVVERATQRVWIDGVEMKLAEWSYRMIEYLASHAGQLVPSKAIAAHIVGRRGSLEYVMKKARPDLLRRVEKSFAAAGKEVPPGLLESLAVVEGKRGYRLALTAQVF